VTPIKLVKNSELFGYIKVPKDEKQTIEQTPEVPIPLAKPPLSQSSKDTAQTNQQPTFTRQLVKHRATRSTNDLQTSSAA